MLGSKSNRRKAKPAEYGLGPIGIKEAYSELTRAGFAAWFRLVVEPPETLTRGRVHLAKVLGYSERRADDIFRELKRKGYIRLIRAHRPGLPTRVVIERRPLINRRDPSFAKVG